jgi:hypothetical protein
MNETSAAHRTFIGTISEQTLAFAMTVAWDDNAACAPIGRSKIAGHRAALARLASPLQTFPSVSTPESEACDALYPR